MSTRVSVTKTGFNSFLKDLWKEKSHSPLIKGKRRSSIGRLKMRPQDNIKIKSQDLNKKKLNIISSVEISEQPAHLKVNNNLSRIKSFSEIPGLNFFAPRAKPSRLMESLKIGVCKTQELLNNLFNMSKQELLAVDSQNRSKFEKLGLCPSPIEQQQKKKDLIKIKHESFIQSFGASKLKRYARAENNVLKRSCMVQKKLSTNPYSQPPQIRHQTAVLDRLMKRPDAKNRLEILLRGGDFSKPIFKRRNSRNYRKWKSHRN